MCGIVGLLGARSDARASRVQMASELMLHRGPDDSGTLEQESISLGFRRLSIIDLSAAGNQPMLSADGQLALVYNGEIYNFRALRRELEGRHQFVSQTDSEVLLHGFEEWGWKGLLERIDGMFAFALWDARTRMLYAARDRVGKKPLYYCRTPNGLAFASTLNALVALLPSSPALDTTALDAYLVYQAVPAPMTLFRGVAQLQPAHSMVYALDTGQLTIERYWDLEYAPKQSQPEADVLDQIDGLIREAVRKRLISDVPLGAFLSGGVDSGLVVSMMAQESSASVEAVVIGFDEPEFDERIHARAVAKRWGVQLHEDVLTPACLRKLPEIVWHYGQPVADLSIVPTYYVAQSAKRHVTVVLNGDGGDEAFGGYARPVIARAASFYRHLPRLARASISRALGGQDTGVLRRAWLLAQAGASSAASAFVYDRAFRSFRDEAYGPELQPVARHWDPDDLYREAWQRAIGEDDVDRSLYGDLTTYLPDQLLSKMDVATMAHSVEARSPLLDRALLEYAARIPTRQRLKGFATKYLLKRVAERYIPREVVYRRKRGFVAPISAWLRTELAAPMRAALESPAFRGRGWIRPAFVRRMLSEHLAGRRDWTSHLWTLLVLEIWARQALDGTLAREDPIEALREGSGSGVANQSNGKRALKTLQIGMGWFDEEPGGLNRFYQELTAALPGAGVDVEGLVAGSDSVITQSHGRIEPVAPKSSEMFARWRGAERRVGEFVARTSSDLVVSHFALYTYPVLKLLRGRPLVVHFQGPWALESKLEGDSWIKVNAKKRIETAVYRRATRCIVLSQAFATLLHQTYGVPENIIRIIPGAVHAARFDIPDSAADARERLQWPADRPIVLTVRRLVRRMGLENLIDAAIEIRRRHPNVLILVAGKGPLHAELEARIRRHKLDETVRLLGYLPDNLLPLAYRAAGLTVVPTVGLEGFGLIVAESLAAGTPALVTPVSSLPEVVRELSPALILASSQSPAIATGICSALDGTLSLPTAAECHRFAAAHYDWSVVAEKIRDVYEEALQ